MKAKDLPEFLFTVLILSIAIFLAPLILCFLAIDEWRQRRAMRIEGLDGSQVGDEL